LKKVVRFPEVDEQMAMIRDENGDDSVPVSTHYKANQMSTKSQAN
jgi:hypothetical protein